MRCKVEQYQAVKEIRFLGPLVQAHNSSLLSVYNFSLCQPRQVLLAFIKNATAHDMKRAEQLPKSQVLYILEFATLSREENVISATDIASCLALT